MLTHHYNSGTNAEDSWLTYETPLDHLHKDLLKKKNAIYDFHYFIEHNSLEELAFCYSRMIDSKTCGAEKDAAMAYNDPVQYEKQIAELFEFMIDPQEMIITELVFSLQKTFDIRLDKNTVRDLFQYSMYHPNAILCHVCRKIEWKYTRRYFDDSGVLECCSCHKNKRKRPDTGELDINFEAFDLKKYNLNK